jgi:hypothetical protein
MNYIGIDCHITTLEFQVVNEASRIIKVQTVATSASNFLEFVRSISKPRVAIIEEGSLAAWLLEVCVQHGEKLVISDPKRNLWIASSGAKEDPIDAGKLAQLARGGYIKEIHHPVGQRRRFRELMTSYHDIIRSDVRIKNKIKAKFLHHH